MAKPKGGKSKPAKPKGRMRPPAPENAWDRQPGESAEAYAAFRTYLLAGTARSTAKVGRGLGKSKALMDRWSSKHGWVRRVDAFEAEGAKRQDEAVLDELEERGREQARIAVETLEAMAAPAAELMRRIKADPKTLEKLSIEQLVPLAATTARAIPRVVQTERLARGQSTTNVGGHRGGPLEVEGEKGRSAAARAAAEQRVADLPDEALEAFLAGAETQRQLSAKARARERAT